MAIKRSLSDVTKGADLLKPELNITYIMAATVGVVVLMVVWKLGSTIFARGGSFVESRVSGVPTTNFKTALGIV